VTLRHGYRYDASSFDVRNAVFVVAMLSTVAAVLAIPVVRTITRAQHDAWDAMVRGGTPGPYGTAPAAVAWSPAPVQQSQPQPYPPQHSPPQHSPLPAPDPFAWPGSPPTDAPRPEPPPSDA